MRATFSFENSDEADESDSSPRVVRLEQQASKNMRASLVRRLTLELIDHDPPKRDPLRKESTTPSDSDDHENCAPVVYPGAKGQEC